MDQKLAEKLARLKNYHSRYEVAATKGGQRVLIGYTPRKGRRGLLSIAQLHGERFARFFETDCLTFGKRASDDATAGEWKVNFSGRTQRDAYISGELPFFVTLDKEREESEKAYQESCRLQREGFAAARALATPTGELINA